VFGAAQTALVGYAKDKARVVQRRLPDGDYSFWDYLDDDYVSPIPIRVRCTMSVRDGHLHLDYTRTDPQVPAAYNVPTGGVRHPWLTLRLMQFVASYDSTIPLNYGLFENMSVSVPKGTLLNPEFPAAVGIRSASAIRVNDVLTGCIAGAAPDLIPAPSGGTVVPVVLAEYDDRIGTRRVQVMQSLVGGTGGRLGADGVDGRDPSLANCFNTPTESSEAEVAAVVTQYGLRPNSGGPGKWRGGTGLIFTMRIDKVGSAVLGRGLERYVFRPYGLAGGGPGMAARVVLNIGTPQERELGKISMVEPEPGDTVTLMSAGGGGYGDPFERPITAVLADLRGGFIDAEAALQDYGVVLRDGVLDAAATEALRAAPRPARPDFDFGPERAVWETVFDDAAMGALVAALLPYPPALRTSLRRDLFARLLPDLGRVPLVDLIPDPARVRAALAQATASLAAGAGLPDDQEMAATA
jgi:N-methylhydantoinase B